jgi:predicted dehydrogenase
MDAVWTRYFPIMIKLRELLAEKAIGDVMLVQSDFGYRTGSINPESRTYSPDFAGGALLDVGIYPIQLASMVYGKQPTNIVSQVTLGTTGVDELSVSVFKYSDYEMATMTTAVRLNTPHETRIMGSKGLISIPDWWHPTEMTVQIQGEDPQTYTYDLDGNGYNYEAEEVGRCIREGLTESDVMTLDESLAIVETMDKIRQQWGLSYPSET